MYKKWISRTFKCIKKLMHNSSTQRKQVIHKIKNALNVCF